MWILSIATIPHIRLHMCRQIDLRLRHVGPRYGPTARPTRSLRAAHRHDFDARAFTRACPCRGSKSHRARKAALVRLSLPPRGRSSRRARIARPAPRRLPSALRRGKASPQRGNEEKRALEAGEAASRVRRPAEARSRPTVRRLGCGTPARRGGGESTFAGLQRCASRSRCTEGHQDPRTPGRLQKAFGRLSADSRGENSLRQPSATIA